MTVGDRAYDDISDRVGTITSQLPARASWMVRFDGSATADRCPYNDVRDPTPSEDENSRMKYGGATTTDKVPAEGAPLPSGFIPQITVEAHPSNGLDYWCFHFPFMSFSGSICKGDRKQYFAKCAEMTITDAVTRYIGEFAKRLSIRLHAEQVTVPGTSPAVSVEPVQAVAVQPAPSVFRSHAMPPASIEPRVDPRAIRISQIKGDLLRVLMAYRDGAQTTKDVMEKTGLPMASASSNTSTLRLKHFMLEQITPKSGPNNPATYRLAPGVTAATAHLESPSEKTIPAAPEGFKPRISVSDGRWVHHMPDGRERFYGTVAYCSRPDTLNSYVRALKPYRLSVKPCDVEVEDVPPIESLPSFPVEKQEPATQVSLITDPLPVEVIAQASAVTVIETNTVERTEKIQHRTETRVEIQPVIAAVSLPAVPDDKPAALMLTPAAGIPAKSLHWSPLDEYGDAGLKVLKAAIPYGSDHTDENFDDIYTNMINAAVDLWEYREAKRITDDALGAAWIKSQSPEFTDLSSDTLSHWAWAAMVAVVQPLVSKVHSLQRDLDSANFRIGQLSGKAEE